MLGITFRFAALLAAAAAGFSAAAQATPLPRVEHASAPALQSVSTPDAGPDIPGVTYPRRAPPDLVPPKSASTSVSSPAPEPVPGPLPAPVPARADLSLPSAAPVREEAPEAAPAALAAVDGTVPAAASAAPPDRDTLKLSVDLGAQRLTVVERGEVKHVWPISSGRPPYRTTTGTFRPQWASRMWYSRQYDMAPMPHAVFFNRGIAFHATNATHLLGRPASHGCVRLAPQNARALYKMIHAHGYGHTLITVTGQIPAATAKREPERRRSRPTRVTNGAKQDPGFFWPFF